MRPALLAISIVVLCFGQARALQVTQIPKTDPEMNVAIFKAQQTLDSFLQLKATGEGGASTFVVKVMLSKGPDREHVWVWPFRSTASGYEGIMKSHPRLAPELKFGQQFNFTRDQITDWGYTKNGKYIGYRTMCVVLRRDPGARAEAKRSGQEYECAP